VLRRWFVISLCVGCCVVGAVNAPALASPEDEYEKTSQDIKEAKQKQEALAAQNRKLESELEALQEKLVRSAARVQDAESDLSGYEEKLKILNDQLKGKKEVLDARKKNLSKLVQAAIRLSQTPQEAIILMPGKTHETQMAADVLKMTSDTIREEMDSIGLQMTELERLKKKVAQNRKEVNSREASLHETRQQLEVKVAERKELLDKLGREQKEQEATLSKLAKKAADLRELIASIAREDKAEKEAEKRGMLLKPDSVPVKGKRGKLRSFARAKGDIRPPVAGRVTRMYGAPEARNQTSKGVLIATRPHAQVTAAYDGEVVFSGPFLNYGRMVIVRHSDDFHTLTAGLSQIDVKVGQFLLEGEPIGAMGNKDASNRLYFELRKNNQPIDPGPWLDGLKK
jgi:murein hydrolase activator